MDNPIKSGRKPLIGTVILAVAIMLFVTLGGCSSKGGGAFEPGTDFKETGNTVHLKATVWDVLNKEIYPEMRANMWGFCFIPKPQSADNQDIYEYSKNAIEYFEEPTATFKNMTAEWEGSCSTPGPTLRVQQGDRVIVEFFNEHVHPHTIHWHGQYVPWESDGVPGSTQDSVNPNNEYTYDFIAKRAGTLWYHCHVDTQFHVMQGLFGVMIVEPQDKSDEPKDIDREQVLVLSTLRRSLVENTPARALDPHADHKGLGGCGVTGNQSCKNPSVDVTADTWMINGVAFPSTMKHNQSFIQLEPGERLRLRILNAGTTFETIHPHGHDFYVTHTDGNPIPKSARVYKDSMPIGPGERMDVVLEGREGNEGVWVMHTHVVNHVTNDGQYPGGMLTKIMYPGFEKQPFLGAELPGGIPYVAPIVYPSDFLGGTTMAVGTSTAVNEAWSFPMTLPCAVRNIRFTVEVSSATTLTAAQNDLTVEVRTPNDQAFALLELGNGPSGEFLHETDLTKEDLLAAGDFAVTVTGQSVESSIKLGVSIDYTNSQAEDDSLGRRCTG